MRTNRLIAIAGLLAVMTWGDAHVSAAASKAAAETPLTAAGNTLEKKYAEMLRNSQAEIGRALPKIDGQKIAAFQ